MFDVRTDVCIPQPRLKIIDFFVSVRWRWFGLQSAWQHSPRVLPTQLGRAFSSCGYATACVRLVPCPLGTTECAQGHLPPASRCGGIAGDLTRAPFGSSRLLPRSFGLSSGRRASFGRSHAIFETRIKDISKGHLCFCCLHRLSLPDSSTELAKL